MKNIILTGIVCLLCIFVALIGYTHQDIDMLTMSPTSVVVNPGQSIQAAINSASPGTNIIVNPGNYSENLKIYKNITLLANGTVNLTQINIAYTQCTVKGFRLSGDYPIVISNTRDVKIIGNTITSNLNGIMSTGRNVNLLKPQIH